MDKVKPTNMTSARLFIESEKLGQEADEFLKRLKLLLKPRVDKSECRI